MSTPEMGKRWIETIYLQTGIKADVKSFSGATMPAYFTELMARSRGEDYFIGGPLDLALGQCKDSFGQVVNCLPRWPAVGRSGHQDDEHRVLQGLGAERANGTEAFGGAP